MIRKFRQIIYTILIVAGLSVTSPVFADSNSIILDITVDSWMTYSLQYVAPPPPALPYNPCFGLGFTAQANPGSPIDNTITITPGPIYTGIQSGVNCWITQVMSFTVSSAMSSSPSATCTVTATQGSPPSMSCPSNPSSDPYPAVVTVGNITSNVIPMTIQCGGSCGGSKLTLKPISK